MKMSTTLRTAATSDTEMPILETNGRLKPRKKVNGRRNNNTTTRTNPTTKSSRLKRFLSSLYQFEPCAKIHFAHAELRTLLHQSQTNASEEPNLIPSSQLD